MDELNDFEFDDSKMMAKFKSNKNKRKEINFDEEKINSDE